MRGDLQFTELSRSVGLYYRETALRRWQHVNCSSGEEVLVGPVYQARYELKADQARFIHEWMEHKRTSPEPTELDRMRNLVRMLSVGLTNARPAVVEAAERGDESGAALALVDALLETVRKVLELTL